MGMDVTQKDESEAEASDSRSSIMIIGAPDVGKTSILKKLMQTRRSALKSGGISCHRYVRRLFSERNAVCPPSSWTIDNKYYTANVGIWLARLADQAQNDDDLPKLQSLSCHCEALVMVFDLSSDASFDSLKSWASRMDLSSFEILLCIGNKADKVPGHYGHTEYRRKVERCGESASDPHPEFLEFGIQRSEGNSLLDESDESSASHEDKRRSRVEWCVNNGIEYIETCAADDVFDECLSIDGDLQGVARLRGALSAHMWQGMVLKSEAKTSQQPTKERTGPTGVSSSDESDFTFEYELLSNDGFSDESETNQELQQQQELKAETSAGGPEGLEPTEPAPADAESVQADGPEALERAEPAPADGREALEPAEPAPVDGPEALEPVEPAPADGPEAFERAEVAPAEPPPEATDSETETATAGSEAANGSRSNKDEASMEAFEHFMQEMSGMRENLRNMPDSQRREMAAQIATRMASMFMDDGDDE